MTTLHSSVSATWLTENAPAISIEIARREFLDYRPEVQAEIRDRVRELITRNPRSYLAKHAREIYGV